MTFLVLADEWDQTAARVASQLATRHGRAAVRSLSPRQLATEVSWSHRVEQGANTTTLRLADGVSLEDGDLWVVLNRLRFVDPPQFAAASAADRDYAGAELSALLASWLGGLRCAVVDRPRPPHLGSGWRSTIGWQVLAGAAGLPTRRLRYTTNGRRFAAPGLFPAEPPTATNGTAPGCLAEPVDDGYASVLVVGDVVVGSLSGTSPAACLRLARSSDTSILELRFTRSARTAQWEFADAVPLPAITVNEQVGLVVRWLETAAAAERGGGQCR